MSDIDFFEKFNEISESTQYSIAFNQDKEKEERISEHRLWMQSIRRERPLPSKQYKVGVYIRYYNQTKYDNYLYYHKKQFSDTIALCPKWELVDFYVDEGATAPNMENSPEWCRLLDDCMSGKVDLIITQKVSNVSRKPYEITFISRMLACQKQPIGIYFISEDVFTLASYYLEDIKDTYFLPKAWDMISDDEDERIVLND